MRPRAGGAASAYDRDLPVRPTNMQSLPFIRKIACAAPLARGASSRPRSRRVGRGDRRRRRRAPPPSPIVGADRLAGGPGSDPDGADGEAGGPGEAPAARPDTRRASAAYLCFGFAATKGSAAAGDGSRKRASASAGRRPTPAPGSSPSTRPNEPLTRGAVGAKVRRPSPTSWCSRSSPGRRTRPACAPAITPGACSRATAAAKSADAARSPTRRSRRRRLPAPSRPRRRLHRRQRRTGQPRPTERKVVALTFDDGPSEYTDRYPRRAARKGRPRRPSSRSARRCPAGKRRCGGSSPKATRSATTR